MQRLTTWRRWLFASVLAAAAFIIVAGPWPTYGPRDLQQWSGALKSSARGSGADLWLLSFNGDYVGYISPDRYYETVSRSGKQGYEVWTMGWFGPQQGELLSRLAERVVSELMPARPHRPVEAGGRTLPH